MCWQSQVDVSDKYLLCISEATHQTRRSDLFYNRRDIASKNEVKRKEVSFKKSGYDLFQLCECYPHKYFFG
jgi:hypothetical protein